jgi:DMSO/TMAO reductase YedYZ molybdopterin-dependent catalytic subunit
MSTKPSPRYQNMKVTFSWVRFSFATLLLILTWTTCLAPNDGMAQGDTANINAQAATSLEIVGDLPNPRRIDATELHRLQRAEVHATDARESGKEIVYTGTPFIEVLKAAGLQLDPGMQRIRRTVALSVIIEAIDGYRAVFSLAELDPELTDRVILLADTKDGQPLSPNEGPFRIIVPSEKRSARWVRQVKAVTVRQN